MRKLPLSMLFGVASIFTTLSAASYYCDSCGQYASYNPNRNGMLQGSNFNSGNGSNRNYQATYYQGSYDQGQGFSGHQGFQNRFGGNFDNQGQNSNFGAAPAQPILGDQFDTSEDRQLLQRIRDAISRNRGNFNPNFTVLVIQKDIILRGQVSNKDEANAIEKAVKNIEGVNSVNNKLFFPGRDDSWFGSSSSGRSNSWFGGNSDQGQDDQKSDDNTNPSNPQDHLLLGRIQETVEFDNNPNFRNAQIRVIGGRVFISGSFPTDNVKRAFLERLNNVMGVQGVEDKSFVEKDGASFDNANTAAALKDDAALRKEIQSQLSGGLLSKGFDNVSVDVTRGVVILRGSVLTNDDLKTISDRIQKIQGIRSVDNQVTVRSMQK